MNHSDSNLSTDLELEKGLKIILHGVGWRYLCYDTFLAVLDGNETNISTEIFASVFTIIKNKQAERRKAHR